MSSKYIYHTQIHNLSAPRKIVPIVIELVKPQSVLDVGCGTGTWLKAFQENGIENFIGIDSHDVTKDQLMISESNFKSLDLLKPFDLHRKFDLVLSLEVGEHLPESSADTYVESLTRHSEVILFSAAIPGQGGQNHINEQWPEYWMKKFGKHGFFFHDLIRPRIWNDDDVAWWYRQNIFLINKNRPAQADAMLSAIHPELYKRIILNHSQYTDSLASGRHGVKASTQIFVKSLIYKLKNLIG